DVKFPAEQASHNSLYRDKDQKEEDDRRKSRQSCRQIPVQRRPGKDPAQQTAQERSERSDGPGKDPSPPGEPADKTYDAGGIHPESFRDTVYALHDSSRPSRRFRRTGAGDAFRPLPASSHHRRSGASARRSLTQLRLEELD